MATATNDTTSSGPRGSAAKLQRAIAARGPGLPYGDRIYKQTVALVAGDLTLNNVIPVISFPANDARGVFLKILRLKITDLDTNGAPLITFSMIAYDSAGSVVATLIANSTKAQAGGNDELDLDLDPTLLDMAGLTIKFKVTAAPATAAAGTLTVYAAVNYDGAITSF